MMPQIVWSGDENYISRPVCESATSTCKYHGVGIYVCYTPTRFVGRREVVLVRRRREFPDLTAYISVARYDNHPKPPWGQLVEKPSDQDLPVRSLVLKKVTPRHCLGRALVRVGLRAALPAVCAHRAVCMCVGQREGTTYLARYQAAAL